jgi:beta-glucosidase
MIAWLAARASRARRGATQANRGGGMQKPREGTPPDQGAPSMPTMNGGNGGDGPGASGAGSSGAGARAGGEPPEVSRPTPLQPSQLGIRSANFRFPGGFLWGAATSAQQVEGGNALNDWALWEGAGRVPASGAACDHYHRYREDFDLAHSIAHNAHRFSLEWSRIEPEEGRFSEEALAHYADVLAALIERGIEPVVTILHYTLPQWLAARGGWECADFERHFMRYVEKIVEAYGDRVHWWITLNEPVVQVFKGWLIGQWPPGKTFEYPAAFQVIRRMLRSHVRAYHAIHAKRADARVGVAQHVLAFTPCNPRSFRDRLSVRFREYIFNQLFVDALHKGTLRVPGLFWERLPAGRTLDFIGLNYYTRDFVHNTGLDIPGLVGGTCPLDHHEHIGKRNALGWEVYPEGLAHFLKIFNRYHLPVLITENGVPAASDEDRWTFIYMHLWQVARAIDEGVNVVGYLYWSLLDNYEWADGYRAKFGLIGVDFATQKRTVRHSARLFAHVIRSGQL